MDWTVPGLLIMFCWFLPWKHGPVEKPERQQPDYVSVCDLTVDAGPDTNVCAPGGVIGLMGSITGNALFYQWSPPSGLSNTQILNPIATISGPITYTLTAYGVEPGAPNLIINGDFELGNTGFVSDYTYVADIPILQNEMVPAGTYTVINDPNLVHTGFSPCDDHTSGNGNMMVVNGAPTLQDVWCQTISILPNTYYNVSAWVASVNPASPAILRFSINGIQIGPTVNAPSATCVWVPFNAVWNSGSNSSAEICIVNLNTASGGNDFAIDDISITALCSVADEVEITLFYEDAPEPMPEGPTFLCEGETGIYTASFPPEPAILTYFWSVSSGATILNGQGSAQVTVLWEDQQEGTICLEVTTRCNVSEGCLDVTVGAEPETPEISGPPSLCPGEVAILYTPEIDPQDIYDWIVPPQVSIISGQGTNELEIEWIFPGEAEICLEVTNACGSNINCTYLILLPEYLTLFDTMICEGSTFDINGTLYGNGLFTGTEYFTSVDGCDSIVEIEITEATTLEFMVTEYLCPGDSLFLEGAFQTEAGIYVDSYTTVSNCDSIVYTELIISAYDTTWLNINTCDSLQAGTVITTYAQGNCDSTVITETLWVPPDTTLFSFFSCLPADTGVIIQELANQYGCDSLIITMTSLLPSDTTLFFQNTCDPSAAGITIQNLINYNGCDSTVITTVFFLLSDTTFISATTCTYADTGTTSTLLVNTMGCDSLVILSTTYAGSNPVFLTDSSCNVLDTGNLVSTYTNIFGCDSIVNQYIFWLPPDYTFLMDSSCSTLDTGTFISLLTNADGCDSIVSYIVSLIPPVNCDFIVVYNIVPGLCFGDPAILHIDFQFGLAPFELHWINDGIEAFYHFDSLGQYAIPLDVPGSTDLIFSSANGLSFSYTEDVAFAPPLIIDIHSPNDYNGFDLACHGDSTGNIILEIISGGSPPLTYAWSNGDVSPDLTNIAAGLYEITVTDDHGCTVFDNLQITQPLPIQYDISMVEISCFGLEDGKIIISGIQGGVAPWMTSLNGDIFQADIEYGNLGAGMFDLVIRDENGCSKEENFLLAEPELWTLDLGNDTSISLGENMVLTPIIHGLPIGFVQLNWSDGACSNCNPRIVQPVSQTTYTVIGTDEHGCTAEDEIVVNVVVDRDIYIPNIFSPGNDQANDHFIIFSGGGLEEISELVIYDRWGNLVFEQFHFQPDDPNFSWDGSSKGEPLNPGVYVYKLILKYKDGRKELRAGDVTLIR